MNEHNMILGNKIVKLNKVTGKRFSLTKPDYMFNGSRRVILDGSPVSPALNDEYMAIWLDACLFGFDLGNLTDWECPHCDNEESRVSNSELADIGPPMCMDCDCEMI